MSYEEIDELKGNDEKKEDTGFDLAKAKEFYAELCKDLSALTVGYKPKKTIEIIEEYISGSGFNRMLYSEITSYMYNLESYKLTSVLHNVEKLLAFTLSEKNEGISVDCKKIVIKIYDHCNLISNQTNNARQIHKKGIERAKNDMERSLKKDFKSLEREYITILGIFVAIILAFVGGITFSSSVLQHMGSVSSYRLFAVIIALGDVMINALFLMMKFICALNNREFSTKWLIIANVVASVLFIVVLVARDNQW